MLFRSSDGFSGKKIVVESQDGEVVYSAIPFVDDDGILISYALHKYKYQSMPDFYVSFFRHDLSIKWTCDLGGLVAGAFYNRPTGVAKKGDQILLGTSWFDQASFLDAEKSIFSQKNKVLIVSGTAGDCESFRTAYERDVLAPYYNSDVSIDEDMNFLFFDKKQYHSNLNLDGCFLDGNNIYPRLVANDALVFMRINNGTYDIRDLDNSLYICRSGFGGF